jgi:hypothetical protein
MSVRVEPSKLRREEQQMPSWKNKLNLADVFHDESRSFEEKRDEIVRRIKAAGFYDPTESWLPEIVSNLAEASDTRTFDSWWDQLYDWADDARVWVATF